MRPLVQARGNGGGGGGCRASGWRCRSFMGTVCARWWSRRARLGLRVQPVGSGLAREQAPAAGTMVPLGTEIVVRFTR